MEIKKKCNKIMKIFERNVNNCLVAIMIVVGLLILFHPYTRSSEFAPDTRSSLIANVLTTIILIFAIKAYHNFAKGNIYNQWVTAQTNPNYYENSFLVEKLIRDFKGDKIGLIYRIEEDKKTQIAVDFILDYFILKATGVEEQLFDSKLAIKLGKCDTILYYEGLRPWIDKRQKIFPCKKDEFEDLKNFYIKCIEDKYLFTWENIPGKDEKKLIGILKSKYNVEVEPTSISKKRTYLFSWDGNPGNDNGRLIEFLKQNFSIDWAKTAKIEKIDDCKTIKVSTEKNYLSLKLNDEKNEVILDIDDGRTEKFVVKKEDSKLNIYDETIINITCEGKPISLSLNDQKHEMNLTINDEPHRFIMEEVENGKHKIYEDQG